MTIFFDGSLRSWSVGLGRMDLMSTKNHLISQSETKNLISTAVIACTILSWAFGIREWFLDVYGGDFDPLLHIVLLFLGTFILWLGFLVIPLEWPLVSLERGSQLIVLFFVTIGSYFSILSSNSEVVQVLRALPGNNLLVYSIVAVVVLGNVAIGLRFATRNVIRPLFGNVSVNIRPLSDRLAEKGRSMPKISFVIPALNEEAVIAATLRRIPCKQLHKLGFETEIIVADNNSEDHTAQVAATCGAMVVSETQRGYGNAYKAGFSAATGDIVVMTDADGTYPVELTHQLIKPILEERAEVVIGSRFLGRIKEGAMPPIHKIGNRLLTLQLNLLFALPFKKPISDAHSGFRAFHADALKALELHTDGMEFASELVIEAYAKSLRMTEIPIDYSPRAANSHAKLRTFRDGARHLLFMLNTRVTGKRATRYFSNMPINISVTSDSQAQHLILPSRLSSMQKPCISVIIPVYNEEMTIFKVVNIIKLIFKQRNAESEILVIDDGSIDNTRNEAQRAGARIIRNGKNRGKGVALRRGFLEAKGTHILTVDGDGAHSFADIQLLIDNYFLGRCDMLIGSRFLNAAGSVVTTPVNKAGNKIFNTILSMLSVTRISDSQSGLRIASRKLLSEMALSSTGYEIETEMSAKALGLGARVEEFPIRCLPRIYGTSHLRAFRDGSRILKTMIFSYIAGLKLRSGLRKR